MVGASALVVQSASTAYEFCKDMLLYAKRHKQYIERLEERMSELITLLISIKSEKEIIDRSLRNSAYMEPTRAYAVVEAEIAVIERKCIMLIEKYTNNRLSSTTTLDASTTNFFIFELVVLKSKIVALNALKLTRLNRDVLKLIMRASEAIDRLRPEKGMQETSVMNPENLDDDDNIVLPVFHTYVDKVMEYLFEEEMKTIGILGCQGAGKTTVLRKLYDRLLQQESLDNIICIEYPPETETADANTIVEVLQKEIMIQLYIDHEAGISTLKNADIISTFLRKKKYMLLIDDASGAIDLEKLGFKKDNMYKVVICSRDRSVLLRMTEHYVEIQGLRNHEALNLFQNICGNLLIDHRRLMAERIIKLCAGIPGIIRQVATYLKDKEDVESWYYVMEILQSNSRSIKFLNMDGFDKVYEMSYYGLEINSRKCLLYAALFPHGYKIQPDYLIECWIAEDFIAIEGKQKVRINREYGRSILNHLIDRDLLQWYPGKKYVMMQPNFRRVALKLISFGREIEIWMPSESRDPDEETWTTIPRMSLISCKTILPESPYCPNMHTLLLQSMQGYSIHIPKYFFRHMISLKVLNLNHTKIRALPKSMKNLVNLKSLYLNGCLCLDDLPFEAACLKKLEFLDICGTSILTLPRVIGFMDNMRCLRVSLSSRDKDAIISPGIIRNLKYLEELSLITTIDIGAVMAERLAWNI